MKAMKEKLYIYMNKNNALDLVDLPLGRKSIQNNWVINIKRNTYGSIERYKTQLVAKEYTKEEGID